MRHSGIKLIPIIAFAILGVIPAISGTTQRMNNPWKPDIPKTWDDEAMQALELPLANAANSPKHISSDYYYSMPVRPIYQSYPIYYPDREPRGYLDSLKQKEPQIIFDASRLKTEEDWIKAGEIVFDAPIEFISQGLLFSEVRDKAWYDKNKVPVRKDGVFPFMRYIIREKGKVEVGILACASCHSRVMPDGSVLKGVQGNFPDDRTFAYESRLEAAQGKDENEVLKEVRSFMRRAYSAPWVTNDPNAQPEGMSLDEIASVLEATIPGICARQGSSAFYPPRIPDLIGVKDRLYLDSSGLVRHRTIGDLMRYAALNQGADYLSLYGTFRPKKLPDPSTESRYSDEQLYALARYVYSLQPPPNPNPFDALARKGQEIFKQEGCAACHTPPLYTNNKLTPAAGFQVPPEHLKKYDVSAASVGTDPRLTLQTRRGTGYYKVPSLKGVWYRGPFEHNGSVATLEDWFDPRRLRDDYVPTGFRGYRVTTRAVKGHPFGLDLSSEDRKALIAFLKTL